MNDPRRPDARRRRPAGFTLVELLVVVVIVILVSAAVLPAVIPALSNRQVSEAARILQAALAGARDAAIRNNAPRGIRLILESAGNVNGNVAWVASRLIPIEPAPDLTDGKATFPQGGFINGNAQTLWTNASGLPPFYPFPVGPTGALLGPPSASNPSYYPYSLPTAPPTPPMPPAKTSSYLSPRVLMIEQAFYKNNNALLGLLNPPTGWFWNVRIGDKFRFGDAGNYYTVVGPMTVYNPELFVNDGPAEVSPYTGTHSSLSETYYYKDSTGNQVATPPVFPEFLFLVNGVDDDDPPNGYIDEGFDGINQNLNFLNPTTPLVDDIYEWLPPSQGGTSNEVERFLGAQATQRASGNDFPYTISRRPVPSPGAKEISLPAGAVIDLTTWNTPFGPAARERSRLPVDGLSYTVDVLLNQAGQVIPFTEYSTFSASPMTEAFYHFWIADRTDVYPPVSNDSNPPQPTFPTLPMPSDAPGYTPLALKNSGHSGLAGLNLKRDRMLVTLFARSGAVVTKSIETFDATGTGLGPNAPFIDAQLGVREAK